MTTRRGTELESPGVGVRSHPLAPDVPLSLWARIQALRELHVGQQVIAAAGGPVTLVRLGPAAPPMAVVTSPQGVHDVLTSAGTAFDKEDLFDKELRQWIGHNVISLTHGPWLPRRRLLQPLFTKQQVRSYGENMSRTAEEFAASCVRTGVVDADQEVRRLTLRILGNSLSGSTSANALMY